MDETRFATVTRYLTSMPSRRHLLRGLAAAGLGLGIARVPGNAVAKKERLLAAQPNAFGCLDVGQHCRRDQQCCSSRCEGKKGKRRCKAHDTGTCATRESPEGCGGTDVACTTSLGQAGTCGTTTGNAPYCQAAGDCYPCTTDEDCQRAAGGVLGRRAACILCAVCEETGGTACAGPKGTIGISRETSPGGAPRP